MANEAIVLSCDDTEISEMKAWLERDKEHLLSASLVTVVNATEDILRALNQALNRDIIHIQERLLTGLFKAKNLIDCNMLAVIKLVCSITNAIYIEKVCQKLFTPVYTYQIIPIGVKRGEEKQSNQNNITKDLELFLTSLPGDGDIFTLHSDLIPGGIFYHGFSTRTGGLSTVPGLKSLNMVYSKEKHDPPTVIAEHQRRLAMKAGFDVKGLQIARTVHGNTVHVLGKEKPEEGYDGVVSDFQGNTCAAPGADCIPMLFADPVNRACGAVHAGWKGTIRQICVETLRIMNENFSTRARDLIVVMGPSICEKCLEFGVEDSKQFEEISSKCILYTHRGVKPTIDLKLANRILLEEHGVKPENIDDKSVSLCTLENPELLYSYRRDGRPFGGQIGYIGIQ